MKQYINILLGFIALVVASCHSMRTVSHTNADIKTDTLNENSFGLTPNELKLIDFSVPTLAVYNTQADIGKLVFVSTKNKTITRVTDIKEECPFNKVGTLENDQPSYQIRRLDNKRLSELFPSMNLQHYVHKDELEKMYDTIKVTQMRVDYTAGRSPNKQFIAVGYIQTIEDLVTRSTIVVYDSTGNEIARFKNIDSGVSNICVTNNGKYLSISIGWDNEEGKGGLVKYGVQIYSILQNKLLYDIEDEKYEGSSISNNFIVAGSHKYTNKKKEEVYLIAIFDVEKKKIYTTELKVDDVSKIMDEGILMQPYNKDASAAYMLLYNRDFKVEELR
jgi:hypothetical protein